MGDQWQTTSHKSHEGRRDNPNNNSVTAFSDWPYRRWRKSERRVDKQLKSCQWESVIYIQLQTILRRGVCLLCLICFFGWFFYWDSTTLLVFLIVFCSHLLITYLDFAPILRYLSSVCVVSIPIATFLIVTTSR